MYMYSIQDKAIALHILKNRKKVDFAGTLLFPAKFITWALKCLRWHQRFNTLLRRYAKELRDAALAMKAIWDNLKAGISLPKMLTRYLPVRPMPKRWQQNGKVNVKDCRDSILYINPKTNKHERRSECRLIADRLQTPNIF